MGKVGVNCYVFLSSLLVEGRVPYSHLVGGIFGRHWPICRAGSDIVKKEVISPGGNLKFDVHSLTSHKHLV